MKSITIHNLDDQIAVLIERISQNEGISQNKTIKKLLSKALGISDRSEDELKEEYEDLFGIWTDKDFKEFQINTNDLNKVDPKDWE